MLMAYIFTPFEWSILSFIILQVIAFMKFASWMNTDIQLLKTEMKENNKRDCETRKDIEKIRNEERQNYKELTKSLSDIIQGLVRVEEKMSHVEKQLDKR